MPLCAGLVDLVTLHGTGGGHFTARAPVYVQREIEGPLVPIHVAGRAGTDLVVVALDDAGNVEIRILN